MKTYFRLFHGVVLLLPLINLSCDRVERWSNDEMSVTWFYGFTKLQVKAKGQFEFTEDDADIKSISRQGYLLIKERHGMNVRQLEVVQGPDGKLQRSYSLQGESRPFNEEARTWLSHILPEVLRQTGFGAMARVQRIRRDRGADAVLEEISRIKSDRVKSIYF